MRYRFAGVLLPVLMTAACSGTGDSGGAETSGGEPAPATTAERRVEILESGHANNLSWTIVRNDEDHPVRVDLDYSVTTEKGKRLSPSSISRRDEVVPAKSTVGIVRTITWSGYSVGDKFPTGETRLTATSRATAAEPPPGKLEATAVTPKTNPADESVSTRFQVTSSYPGLVKDAFVSVLCRGASGKVVGVAARTFDVSADQPARIDLGFQTRASVTNVAAPEAPVTCTAYPIVARETKFR